MLTVCGWVSRRQQAVIDYLLEENKVLRELHGGRRLRLTDAQRRRLARKGKVLGRKALSEVCGIVTPDTILRWYRKLVAAKYDGSAKRAPGRPKTRQELRDLVLRMAKDNPRWGYTRLVGALANLGHELGRTTVKRILAEEGIMPAPERSKGTRWSTFLRAQWDAIAGADFFAVEVLSLFGLTRYFVFFVMELQTRRVHVAGIVHQPHGRWMMQIGRSLIDEVDGFLRDKRFLILDRDPVYTAAFRRLLDGAGVRVVRLPARSPNLNAFAETLRALDPR